MIEPLVYRPAIAKGEWHISIQLKVDGQNRGGPLELRFADTFLNGAKSTTKGTKGSTGMPADFGYLMTQALWERALTLRKAR